MPRNRFFAVVLLMLLIMPIATFLMNGCSSSSGSDPGPNPSPSPSISPSPSPSISPSPSPTSPYVGTVVGTITDSESGQPVEDAEVYINLGAAVAGRTIIMDTTKEDGTYRLTQLPGGDFTLNARKSGYTPGSGPVTVTPGEETTADLTIERVEEPGNVAGTVTDSVSGNPLSGVIVTVGAFQGTTASDGTYFIDGLEPGEHNVIARRINYRNHPTSGTDSVNVTAGQTATKNITMTKKEWTNVEVERITSPATNLGQYSSLAFGPDNKAKIGYYDLTNTDLKFAGETGSAPAWSTVIVDSVGSVGTYASIAINAVGDPTLAYYSATTGNTGLRYAWYNSLLSSWVVETAVSVATAGQHNSIGYYPNGDVGISYYYGTSPYGLYFVRRTVVDGTVYWSTPVLVDASSANMGQYTSLKFNASGYPSISYYDVTNTDLKYAEFNGSWQTTTVHLSTANVGQYSSLAYGPDAQPSIAYYDATNLDLLYVKRNGAVWGAPQTIDATGTVGQYASLAFSPEGYPCIAYYDATTGVQDLKFAWYDGQGWQTETVFATGNVGQYASLAFDADGNPAIAYYDVTNTSLRYSIKK